MCRQVPEERLVCIINVWMTYACAALAVKGGLCDSNQSPSSALLPPILQAWSSPGGRSPLRRWWPGPCSGTTDRRQTAVPWRDPMWGFTSLHTGWVLCVSVSNLAVLWRQNPGRFNLYNQISHVKQVFLLNTYVFLQPQIRKCWDSMENANKKKKVVISKFTLTCISLQTIWTQNISCFVWSTSCHL